MQSQNYTTKQLIIFDLDGTLAESKSAIDDEMLDLLHALLQKKSAAVIGGGSYEQFEKQMLARMAFPPHILSRLSLFPTSGARFYAHDNGWREVYSHNLSSEEKQKILNAFQFVFQKLSYAHPARVYGEMFEDRGTQIAFSPLGQRVVDELGSARGVLLKEEWNKKYDATRQNIAEHMRRAIPEFEVRAGGLTTIDVTKKGIDKGYGVRQIEKFLKVPKSEMLFIGDALYEGGNDYPVLKEGVESIAVKSPEETKTIIRNIISI